MNTKSVNFDRLPKTAVAYSVIINICTPDGVTNLCISWSFQSAEIWFGMAAPLGDMDEFWVAADLQ